MTFALFLDNDGVCGGFDEHVKDLFGSYPVEIADDTKLWELVETVPDFWLTMPVKEGAYELFNHLKPYNPTILTGCPKSNYEIAALHKVEWVKKNFGDDVPVITCLSRNKPLHMNAPGDLLIDDFFHNIKRWRKAGGVGIRYKNWQQAIEDFDAFLEENKSSS